MGRSSRGLAARVQRRAGGAAVGLLGTAWAGALVVAGLWLCWTSPGRWPMFAPASVCAGLTLVAMGQFVFLSLVADRAFPEIGRGVGRWLEMTLLLLAACGLVASVAAAAWGVG